MLALLYDPSLLQDHDVVRRDDGRQPVGDNNHGLAFYQGLKGLLPLVFVLRIGEGRGFVQYQYRRILQNGAGHAYPLRLAARQIHALVAYSRLVALRQPLDELVALGGFGRRHDRFFRCGGGTDGDVLVQRVVEQERILKDE